MGSLKNKELTLQLIQLVVIMSIVFARPFMGIFIGPLRIGEILTAFGLIYFLLNITFLKRSVNTTEQKSKLYLLFRLIFVSFLFIGIYFNTDFLNPYVYKSSSYIWTLGFFFLGIWYFSNKENFKYFQYLPSVFLLIIYAFTTIKYPDLFHDILIKYSDKFDTHKGSEILLTYVVANLLNKKFLNEDKYFIYLFLSSSLMLPLFFYMSRGATISCVIFFVTQIWQLRIYIKRNFRVSGLVILLSASIFSFSAVNISTDIFFQSLKNQSINTEQPVVLVQESVNKVVGQKNYDGMLSFYFKDGRLFTGEMNANWRLILWQDVILDMSSKDLIITGYGYSDIIPTMLKSDNNGWDGTNENVHNYFVQIFARGGLIQLVLFVLFYLFLIFEYFRKHKKFTIIEYIFPILFVSLFDTPMESVRFPLVFYFFLAFFFLNKDISNSISKIRFFNRIS